MLHTLAPFTGRAVSLLCELRQLLALANRYPSNCGVLRMDIQGRRRGLWRIV